MTTNIELKKISECLQIPNFQVCMRDEIKNINKQLPLSIIVNLEDSSKNGSHWSLCFIDNKQKIYYSSFGDTIPLEVKEYMLSVDERPILSSDVQLQDFNETTCGLWSILFSYL